MCGISGIANCGEAVVLARMNSIQAHRGPDDSGIWSQKFPDGQFFGLGSRRLAILDLSSSGHMPMGNRDRSLWITFNGEIYNFRALRQELESKGHHFTSHTDTEVVLHLYEQEGVNCVRRLNGMFAFAICDLRAGTPTLLFVRDHFGIKPLYYWQQGRRLAFASEIKALLQVPGIEAALDHDALHQYLTFLWVPDPKTMFQGIEKLPAGHYGIFRDGRLEIRRYWDLEFPPAKHRFPREEEDLAVEIRERLQASVKEQLVSDVPVGAFLSAGLDSSSIVAMMAAERPVKTYTITYPDKYRIGENTLDNPDVPRRLAERLGCPNEQIVVEPDVAALLPKLIWHMDEPIADPAIIPAYIVCREASKNTTVLLSGVGGDELFGGYRKYLAHRWSWPFRVAPVLSRPVSSLLLRLPSFRGNSIKGMVRLVKKLARSAHLPPTDAFVMNCTYLNHELKAELFANRFTRELPTSSPALQHELTFDRVGHADFLNQMLYADTKIFMTSLNLTYNDKMSMASSVEVRVPFLNRELAEFVAWNVPPKWKVKGTFFPATKHILRKAMAPILPSEVLHQRKAGFAAPIDYWLANEMTEMVDDLLSESLIRKRGIFQPEAVRSFIEEHRSGKEDWSMQIWQFLTLELWMRTFLDRSAATNEVNPHCQMASA